MVAPPAQNHPAAGMQGTRSRPGHPPRRRVADALAALGGLGLGVTLGLVITGETRGSLAAPGGWLIAGGRLAGFTGAYLMLVMVVLIGRLPWLERAVGQDRLVRWHRRIGPWPLGLITAHVVLITLGYAQLAKVGALRQLWVFLSSYPDILAAAVGFCLLVMAGITSIKIARRHLKYETWWIVHLYTYLALALAFAHQITTGGSFIGHPLTKAVWIAIWILTAGVVILFRFAQPIVRSLRHQLRIATVARRGAGCVLGHLFGPSTRSSCRLGRSVLQVAVPYQGALVARAPLLPLRPPSTAVPPSDDQRARRPEPAPSPPSSPEPE